MEKDVQRALSDLDTECLGAQTMAEGAMWATLPAMLVMIDAGLIDKGRALAIIDAIHGIASATDRLGDVQDATLGLERLRGFLEGIDLQPGSVLEKLQAIEQRDGDHFLKLQGRRRLGP